MTAIASDSHAAAPAMPEEGASPAGPALPRAAIRALTATSASEATAALLASLLDVGFRAAVLLEAQGPDRWWPAASVGAPGASRAAPCLRHAAAAARLGAPSVLRVGCAELEPVSEAAWGEVAAFAPAWSRGRVIGVVGADSSLLTQDQLSALEGVSALLGPVLETWRLEEESRTRTEALLAVQRIGREMTASLDLEGLLSTVVEEARRFTGADGAVLYLMDRGGERLRLEAWAGEEPPPGRESLAVGYGIPGWAAQQGQILRVSDRGAGGEHHGARRSQLAAPLVSEGSVVGVLALDSVRDEAFSADHEEIVGIFAAQAAKAIEAGRLFDVLRQERDLRDRILAGTPNGVLALDRERRIVWINPAARRVLGIQEEPEGNPIERYLGGRGVPDALHRVLTGEAKLENLEVSSGAGLHSRHLLLSLFPLPMGDRPGAGIVIQDLTERRRLDEQVQRMARLASIGQLAAGIAHEIRNPLTGVAITLDVLREQETLTDGGAGLLDDIGREIDRLELLIRGILDFARPQPVQPRHMTLAKALEWHRTFQEQCAKKGVRFTLEQRHNPRLNGDPEKLKQLFLNIALNALDATPPGGEVRIGAAEVPGDPPRVLVTVEDTGAGMDGETLGQVFNPFFTTKSHGTGLGLAIANSVAEQHGGRIAVESALGEGTCFTVELPGLAPTGGKWPAPEEDGDEP